MEAMKTLLSLALLFPIVSLAPADCPDCLPGTRKAKLCEPHADAEKAELKACASGLKKKVSEERLAALRELAALTEEHANAPSPMLVKTLARGLGDEEDEVVLGTIELLGGQHPEAVLGAYSAYVKKLDKRSADLIKSADKVHARQEKRSSKRTKDPVKRRREELEDEAELKELREEADALDRIIDGMSAQLGKMRDDRAVRALDAMLELGGRETTRNALAELGNVDAAEALLRDLERHVGRFETFAGVRRSLGEAAELTGQEVDTEIEKLYEDARKPVAEAHAALTKVAESVKLGGPRELNPEVGEAWSKWMKLNGESLPPAFGRMRMPWDE